MATIHGMSWKVLKHLRKSPATLPVFWTYCAMANEDNVAWPSLRGLAHITAWATNTCGRSRKWLVTHGALEPVKDYIRPAWRKLPEDERKKRMNLDKAEYYRPTGQVIIDGVTYSMLYHGITPDEIDEGDDVSSGATSHAGEHRHGDTELDSSRELDSSSASDIQEEAAPELDTSSAGASGAAQGDPPKSEAKSRKKDLLFEAICLCVNEIPYDQASKGQRSRTGQFKAELVARAQCKVKPPTPEEIGQFRQKYKAKCPGMDFPKDVNKFADWFVEIFRAEIKVNGNGTGAGTQGITPTIQYPVYGEEEEPDETTVPDV